MSMLRSHRVLTATTLAVAICAGQPRVAAAADHATVYSMSEVPDGALPQAALTLGSDGLLYSSTSGGGAQHSGTLFSVSTAGSLQVRHAFTGADGSDASARPIQGSDGNFYGITMQGGSQQRGTLYQMTPAGVVTTLHHFGTVPNDGYWPRGTLVQAPDGKLYGVTMAGGKKGLGTVFRISTTGDYEIVHTFSDVGLDAGGPISGLIIGSDGNFYGMSDLRGGFGFGTIYRMSSKGKVKVLHSFDDAADGGGCAAELIEWEGWLYGTCSRGGQSYMGTVVRIRLNGKGFKVLHSFSENEGSGPVSGLVRVGNMFYGTTQWGGPHSRGTVYKISAKGEFTRLWAFGSFSQDGLAPYGGLVLAPDGLLYGTTQIGGANNAGSIYSQAP
ncbi:choice-of-anchor tandem repeat GloVer-containing protein [Ideonella sp. DXS29W]|uniref:Choice-of-anchor tandem repeat GloVer-containing protein n=1 Tax=Ideonella lacteola TaxID=2984193 RepID=A0ABU9BZF1_9BURK